MRKLIYLGFLSSALLFSLNGCQNADHKQYAENQADENYNIEPYQDASPTITEKVEAPKSKTQNNLQPKTDNSAAEDNTAKDGSYLSNKRQVIRTANLKFQVKNVENTTGEIEDLSRKFDGFVVNSNLSSTVSNANTIRMSNDSVLEIKEYTVVNNLTIRVPNEQFDTLLKVISKTYSFLDSRNVNADDVSLMLLSNDLKAKAKLKLQERLHKAVDNKGKKLDDIVGAETTAASLEENAIDKKLASIGLQDKIEYSTISINMYQEMVQAITMKPNVSLDKYGPSLSQRFADSFAVGWSMLVGIMLFFINMWSIILLGILGFALYRIIIARMRRAELAEERSDSI